MIEVGKVAYIKTTDEPVLVVSIETDLEGTDARVRRGVQTSEGIEYRFELFSPAELQTEEERLIHELELTKLSLSLRERYAAEYKASQEKAKLKEAVSQADGAPYVN